MALTPTGGRAGGRSKRSRKRYTSRALVKPRDISRGGIKMSDYRRTARRRLLPKNMDVSKLYSATTRWINRRLMEELSQRRVDALTKRAPRGTTFRKGRRAFYRIEQPDTTGRRSEDTIPAQDQQTVILQQQAGNSNITNRIHNTRFETGRASSSILKTLSKMNGTKRVVLYDTKIDQLGSAGFKMVRSQLTNAAGFNSRGFFIMPGLFAPNALDIRRLFNPGGTSNDGGYTSNIENLRQYASILEHRSLLHIYNQNTFHALRMKIHVVKVKNELQFASVPQYFAGNIVDDTKPTDIPQTTQYESGIPSYYLHSGSVSEGNTSRENQTLHWQQSLKGPGLMASPRFRDEFRIVKTFTKRLEPGEHWQFNHTHHYGGGLDLARVFINTDLDPSTDPGYDSNPVAYQFILEVQGYPCEGIYKPDTSAKLETRSGTNPCFYTMEFKKDIKFVLASYNSEDDLGFAQDDASNVQRLVHVRTFTQRDARVPVTDSGTGTATLNQEFHVNPFAIVAGTPVDSGTLAVPVVTNTNVTSDVTPGNVNQGDEVL
jgi:hypothetical protein